MVHLAHADLVGRNDCNYKTVSWSSIVDLEMMAVTLLFLNLKCTKDREQMSRFRFLFEL